MLLDRIIESKLKNICICRYIFILFELSIQKKNLDLYVLYVHI